VHRCWRWDLAFDENRVQPQIPAARRVLAEAENSPILVKYAALLMGLLVVLAFGVRPALRLSRTANVESSKTQVKNSAGELSAETATQHVFATPEPMPMDPERIRAQEIFEQVVGHLKGEPTQSSRLLQSWIHSD